MYEILDRKQKLIEVDSDKDIVVEYAVLVHPIAADDGIYLEQYGIRVSTYSKNHELLEFVEIPNITMRALEIDRIFMVLFKYTVTPVSLYDVMDNYLEDPDHFACLSEELV